MIQEYELPTLQSFLSLYTPSISNSETINFTTPHCNYLLKVIDLNTSQTSPQELAQTLEIHQHFQQKHINGVKWFTIDKGIARVLYGCTGNTLKQQIVQRRQFSKGFEVEQMWTLFYSITKALLYLEELNIAYGVLSSQFVYLDGVNIKLLDPSAVGADPLQIQSNRPCSPQVAEKEEDINMLKSDVYVFGLILLEAGLLLDFGQQQQDHLEEYCSQFQHIYGQQLTEIIAQMLSFEPSDRPSFQQICNQLEKYIEQQPHHTNSLALDMPDQPSLMPSQCETYEYESIDLLNEEEEQISDYDKARLKFLQSSPPSSINSSVLKESDSKLRKVSKIIKEKLVKKQSSKDVITYRSARQSIYTDPKIMAMIHKDMSKLAKDKQNRVQN